MTTRLPRPARLALLGLGIAFGLGSELARLLGGWSPVWVVADLLPGLVFLVCGHIAWERRPDNRVGPLMIAIGFAWYVGTYGAVPDPAISRAAHAFQGYYDALLAWLILAYPSGRLSWRTSRAVVAAFFGVLAARTAFRFAIIRPSTEYGDLTDPAVAERYVADITMRADGEAMFRTVIAVLAIAVVALVIARWRAQTVAGRRVAGPILLGGLAFAVGIVLEYGIGLVRTTNILDRVALGDVGQYLTVVTAALVPIGFLVGLTRARIARGGVADLVLQLDAEPDRPALREVLARALGDPSLEVAYAVPGTDGFVDLDGRALAIPSATDTRRAVTRLERTLERATTELELALAELRELARGLHPTVLVEDGLAAAVESLADRSPVPVTVQAPDIRFAPALEATAYFVVAEALTNVAKYARATRARVDIDRRDDVLVVEIVDDGVGGADPGRGSGLRGLDDRVAAAGGRLTVTSRPGEGTIIRAEIPCA